MHTQRQKNIKCTNMKTQKKTLKRTKHKKYKHINIQPHKYKKKHIKYKHTNTKTKKNVQT